MFAVHTTGPQLLIPLDHVACSDTKYNTHKSFPAAVYQFYTCHFATIRWVGGAFHRHVTSRENRVTRLCEREVAIERCRVIAHNALVSRVILTTGTD